MSCQRLLGSALSCALILLSGCDDESSPAATGGAAVAPAAALQPQPNYVVGRVTMADGKPLTGEVKDITIRITGIGAAAENISYTPAVKPDGTYKQKVSNGQFRSSGGEVTVLYNGATEFRLPLEPVGSNWNKSQDAADGIVQDYVWKPTGPTPYGTSQGLDKRNGTHWYGMSVGMSFQGFRSDKNVPAVLLPEGTTLVFTCKPTSKAIDGSQPGTKTIEMPFNPKDITYNDDIADLPPADWEITGIAKLPDGATKPLIFQGKGDYPNYKPVLKAPLEKDNSSSGGYFKQLAGFGYD